MKIFLTFCFFFLINAAAQAATFDSFIDTGGKGWLYTFTIKSSTLSVRTPLTIQEKSCAYYAPTTKNFLKPPTDCFNTETDARAHAQKMADQHEKDFIANGFSSTVVEATRLKNKEMGTKP